MGKLGVCLRERCPGEECLFRKEEVSVWSPSEQRAPLTSAQPRRRMGNQLAERCLHRFYAKHRAVYRGRKEMNLDFYPRTLTLKMWTIWNLKTCYMDFNKSFWISVWQCMVLVSACSLVQESSLHCMVSAFCDLFLFLPQGLLNSEGNPPYASPAQSCCFFPRVISLFSVREVVVYVVWKER